MRRGSLFAPLLLIAIGALFLARNIIPDLPLLDYLAKYWPFLLIVWGGLRLAEIAFWASTSRPLPRQGISGGEWVLVVFLCMFGFGFEAARGFSNWLPRNRLELGGLDMFGESYEYPVSGEKATSPAPRVVIDNFRGNARIIAAEGGGASTVKVTGHKTIRSMDQNGADRADRDSPFEIGGDANRVTIQTNQDRPSGTWRISSELEITVPKGSTIEAHGRYGDFDISGINGNVEVNSDNAGVRLENIGGAVRLELRRSDIVRAVNLRNGLELKGNGSDIDLENIDGPVTINGGYTGMVQFHNLAKPLHFIGPQTEFQVEKLTGEVRMPLGQFTAQGLTGPVRLTSRSRDVQISNVTNSLDISIDRGDIDVRPGMVPLPKINIHTRAGDVELALPLAAKFDLTASSERGEVVNDYGDPVRMESSRHGGTLRGSNGGPEVNVETVRGRIVVRKASLEDNRPAEQSASLPAEKVPESPKSAKEPKGPKALTPIEQ